MEFEDWEYLYDNNLFTSQTIEEGSSDFVYEQDQLQVLADHVVEDQGDVQVEEIEEINEECDTLPQAFFENKEVEEIEEINEECDTLPQAFFENKEVEFEEEESPEEENSEFEMSRSSEFEEEVEEVMEVDGSESNGNDCVNGFNQSFMKWGIGALSSVGIAAATLTVFMLGGSKRAQQNREVQIQDYADDKRMKEVVKQAANLNQALRAVRATPATTANLSFGGFLGI